MRKTLDFMRTKMGNFVQFFILSPRWKDDLYNPDLFDDDETGKPVDQNWSFDDVEQHHIEIPTTVPGKRRLGLLKRRSQDINLNAWLFQHPTSKLVVLFNIGRAGDIQQKLRHVRLLLDAGQVIGGFSVFVFEYRGFGASPGKATVTGICEDGVSAYDYLRIQFGYKPEQIIIFGESLGSAVAANTASERPALGLIMQAPFISLQQIIIDWVKVKVKVLSRECYPLKLVPKSVFPLSHPALDNLAIVKATHPPLLLVDGAHDNVIPPYHSKVLFAGAAQTKTIVWLPNSKHSDLGMAQSDIPLFVEGVKSFLRSLV